MYKCQTLYSGGNKKNIIILSAAELPREKSFPEPCI